MTTQQAPGAVGARLTLEEGHLTLAQADRTSRYHYVWLRDNC